MGAGTGGCRQVRPRPRRSAYVPDLPGCVAAAETEEDVFKLIREAIDLDLESLREEGEPVPEPTSHAAYVEV